ncbi:MAG: nicotinate (nicotinamide) nucleotide adenylyltransferase, partial [Burkholderiales bacterium]
HIAHVALVEAALSQFALDAVHVLPTGAAWHKPRQLSDAMHRLEMTRLAFAGNAKVIVDDREIRRGGPTYTVDTLRELSAESPGSVLHLIVGADQANALTRWHDWQGLLAIATICVATRGHGASGNGSFDPENPPNELQGGRFERLDFDGMDVSATRVRARAARGEDIAALVPPAVARYIAKHHLYTTA